LADSRISYLLPEFFSKSFRSETFVRPVAGMPRNYHEGPALAAHPVTGGDHDPSFSGAVGRYAPAGGSG
jgi:hypothetical protein